MLDVLGEEFVNPKFQDDGGLRREGVMSAHQEGENECSA
jgi:hypothetical protein